MGDEFLLLNYIFVAGSETERGTKAHAKVCVPDDVKFTITVSGHVCKRLLKDVLHVPDFDSLLISKTTLDSKGVFTVCWNS